MKIYVKEFESLFNYHICEDESGKTYRMDLMVYGDLPDDTDPEDLVEKWFEIEDHFPHISIARGVKACTEPNGQSESSASVENK